MGKLEKIDSEIQDLDRTELAALRKWFRDFDAEARDREMEADAASFGFGSAITPTTTSSSRNSMQPTAPG